LTVKRRNQIPKENIDNPPPKAKRVKVDKGAGTPVPTTSCDVSIHPLESREGLIIRVVPPGQPVDKSQDHVPCDIVLLIDVSVSMYDLAPAPPSKKGGNPDQTGMTVLDLTKHAGNSIIETLVPTTDSPSSLFLPKAR
jgi:hypothetical protein